VDDFGGLLLDRLNDFGVAMAGIGDGDAGGEIKVAVALRIPDIHPLRVIHDQRGIATDNLGDQFGRIE
jgi:hypothetical protein